MPSGRSPRCKPRPPAGVRAIMNALALALLSALAAPEAPETPETVRILAIELTADGRGGTIRTEPVRLAGTEGALSFGEGACRKHPLGDRVLEQLFDAMESQRAVVFGSIQVDRTQCVQRVTFVGPRG